MFPFVDLKPGITLMTLPMKRLSVSLNQVGHWLLLVGPNTIRPILAKIIAGLAIEEPVRVLDCGRMLNGIEISMNLRDRPEALDRVSFTRASSCPEVLKVLEDTPSIAVPFVVLNLLHPFYNDSLVIATRKRLLKECLGHLNRLSKTAGGVVSVCPPKVPSKERAALFKMVEEAAGDNTYRVQVVVPSPDLRRLY
jgi:hypothetical protein